MKVPEDQKHLNFGFYGETAVGDHIDDRNPDDFNKGALKDIPRMKLQPIAPSHGADYKIDRFEAHFSRLSEKQKQATGNVPSVQLTYNEKEEREKRRKIRRNGQEQQGYVDNNEYDDDDEPPAGDAGEEAGGQEAGGEEAGRGDGGGVR